MHNILFSKKVVLLALFLLNLNCSCSGNKNADDKQQNKEKNEKEIYNQINQAKDLNTLFNYKNDLKNDDEKQIFVKKIKENINTIKDIELISKNYDDLSNKVNIENISDLNEQLEERMKKDANLYNKELEKKIASHKANIKVQMSKQNNTSALLNIVITNEKFKKDEQKKFLERLNELKIEKQDSDFIINNFESIINKTKDFEFDFLNTLTTMIGKSNFEDEELFKKLFPGKGPYILKNEWSDIEIIYNAKKINLTNQYKKSRIDTIFINNIYFAWNWTDVKFKVDTSNKKTSYVHYPGLTLEAIENIIELAKEQHGGIDILFLSTGRGHLGSSPSAKGELYIDPEIITTLKNKYPKLTIIVQKTQFFADFWNKCKRENKKVAALIHTTC